VSKKTQLKRKFYKKKKYTKCKIGKKSQILAKQNTEKESTLKTNDAQQNKYRAEQM
jgi:hypothetical protein